MKTTLTTFFVLFLFIGLSSQVKNDANFEIAIKKTDQDIRVKLFPRSLAAFESYRHNGLQCEIITGSASPRKVLLQPASKSEWTNVSANNKKVAAAYEMLTKENTVGNPKSLEEKVKADKLLRYSHGFYLLLTCMDSEASALSGMEINIPNTTDEITIKVSSTNNASLQESYTLKTDRIIYLENSPEIFGFSEEHAVRIAWDHEDYFSQVMSYMVQEKNNQGKFMDMDMPNKIYTTQEQEDPKFKFKMNHLDSLSQNYVNHTYRLVAIDAFGDRMNPSAEITIAGRDLTPPTVPERFKAEFIDNQAKITWNKPAEDIDRLLVLRSETGEGGPFEKRHEEFFGNKKQEFIDKIEDPETVYFYLLLVADSAGNVSKSYPQYLDIPDDYPPNVALDVKANVDSLGKVILYWHHNDNKDLRGYKVFRSENDQQEFIQVSKGAIASNVFHDQLNLKKHNPIVKYYVKALDMSYNHSISSDTIIVLRPDTISPSAPILRRADLVNDKINLAWLPSSSKDVKQYLVMADTGSGWWQLSAYEPNVITAQIQSPQNLREVSFKITAMDEVGNTSRNEAGRKVIFPTDFATEMPFELNFSDGEITISWMASGDESQTLVYRTDDDGKPRMLSKVNSKETTFIDRNVTKGEKYVYMIAKVKPGGLRSGMSVAQEIKAK